jgi:phosphoribosylaminoimidazole carboxylase PurE protein
VIIAGAGGAAHLPGMVAALTALPVIGVPVKSSMLSGVDSLYSIVQMPKGIPVATVAIGTDSPRPFESHDLFGSRLGFEILKMLAEILGRRQEFLSPFYAPHPP